MTLEVTPLHPIFAAEARGADVQDGSTLREIETAVDRYAVLVLRDLAFDDAGQVAFSRRFGPLELPPVLGVRTAAQRRRVGEGLYDVSNLDADGEIEPPTSPRRRFGKADLTFHADSSFNSLPTKWSLLYGKVVPPRGGNTEFIDLRAVYAELPDAMKARITDKRVWHSLWHSRANAGFEPPAEEVRNLMPPVLHPLVGTARDGRPTLAIGSHAMRIEGMEAEASAALLQELQRFAEQPQFIYSHKWQAGDLVIWDNRCTLHRATPFEDAVYKRDMRRTTILEYGEDRSAVAA